jgi:hypothetical protein
MTARAALRMTQIAVTAWDRMPEPVRPTTYDGSKVL